MTSLRREKVIFTPSEEQRHRPCLLRPRCCVSLLTCSINLSVRDGRAECQWMMINHFVCDLVELRKIRLSRGFPTSCKERNLERVKESVKCNQQITHFFFYLKNNLQSKHVAFKSFLFFPFSFCIPLKQIIAGCLYSHSGGPVTDYLVKC